MVNSSFLKQKSKVIEKMLNSFGNVKSKEGFWCRKFHTIRFQSMRCVKCSDFFTCPSRFPDLVKDTRYNDERKKYYGDWVLMTDRYGWDSDIRLNSHLRREE